MHWVLKVGLDFQLPLQFYVKTGKSVFTCFITCISWKYRYYFIISISWKYILWDYNYSIFPFPFPHSKPCRIYPLLFSKFMDGFPYCRLTCTCMLSHLCASGFYLRASFSEGSGTIGLPAIACHHSYWNPQMYTPACYSPYLQMSFILTGSLS